MIPASLKQALIKVYTAKILHETGKEANIPRFVNQLELLLSNIFLILNMIKEKKKHAVLFCILKCSSLSICWAKAIFLIKMCLSQAAVVFPVDIKVLCVVLRLIFPTLSYTMGSCFF